MLKELTILEDETLKKLKKLEEILLETKHVAIAFSGGVDSTFLLKFAHEVLGSHVIAVTANAVTFAPDEIQYAKEFCEEQQISHVIIDVPWDTLKIFAKNPVDRCYICKKAIFSTIISGLTTYANKISFPANFCLADGTNADDVADYRPGSVALKELGVLSPLLAAGLTKQEIRASLKAFDMPIWDKPAFACLASRIPYDEIITPEKLKGIYTVEKALMDRGFRQVRVRCHTGGVARIEVLPEQRQQFFDTALMDQINEIAKAAGFTYIALDLAGYKMGNMNIHI